MRSTPQFSAGGPKGRRCNTTRWAAFHPFDPVAKRAEAEIEESGKKFKVAKGAPQMIVELRTPDAADRREFIAASVERDGRWFRHRASWAPMAAATGASLASFRYSIRRATIATPRPRQPGRWASILRWCQATTKRIARQIAGQLDLGQNIVVADTVFGDKKASTADTLAKIVAAMLGAVARLLLGSVSHKLVNSEPVPVMVAP